MLSDLILDNAWRTEFSCTYVDRVTQMHPVHTRGLTILLWGSCTLDVSKFFCGARVHRMFLNTDVLGFVQFIVDHSCEENDIFLWWLGSKQQILPIRREENDRTEKTVTKDRTEK